MRRISASTCSPPRQVSSQSWTTAILTATDREDLDAAPSRVRLRARRRFYATRMALAEARAPSATIRALPSRLMRFMALRVGFNAAALASPRTGIGNYIAHLQAALAASGEVDLHAFLGGRWHEGVA